MTESGQQVGPAGEPSPHSNGAYQSPSCGSDQRGGVIYSPHAVLMNICNNLFGKAAVIKLDIVLEYEASYGTSGFIFSAQCGEDEDKVIVEVRILVQKFQSLSQYQIKSCSAVSQPRHV